MTPLRSLRSFPQAALVVLLATTARPCGPYEPVFHLVVRTLPDGDPADWRAGHLGLIQPALRTRDLVVAWRWLAGVGLNAEAQASLTRPLSSPGGGLERWAQARAAAGAAPRKVDQERPGPDYTSTPAIGDHALRLAAETLEARVKTFGRTSPHVKDWLAAQDAVFDLARTTLPPPAGPDLPLLLRQDRAYQIAAARFYREDYGGALEGFRVLARTDGHPWQAWSRFMVARLWTRAGAIAGSDNSAEEALAQLEALRRDPRQRPLRQAVDALDNLIHFKEDAPLFYTRLLQHLADPTRGSGLAQDIEDLRWLRVMEPWDQALKDVPPAGVHAWIRTFQNPDPSVSLAAYDRQPDLPHLVAVMVHLPPQHPRCEAFLALAQRACRTVGPAYPTLVTHRLRILLALQRQEAAEALADEGLAQPGAVRWPSAWNLWSAVKVARAGTLEAFASHLGRRLASMSAGGWDDEQRDLDPRDPRDLQALDPAAAALINQQLPLTHWEALLASPAFPPSLRPELLEALWARAAVLGREDLLKRHQPALARARPALAGDLAAWSADPDPSRRRARAFLLVWDHRLWPQVLKYRREALQFSTEYQRWGDYRPQESPMEDETRPVLVALPSAGTPAFLDAPTRQAGEGEARRIPMPLTWFCREALAFAEARPQDPLVPGALSRAVRSSRKATRDDQSAALVVQAFRLLHKAYPGTPEARATKVYH